MEVTTCDKATLSESVDEYLINRGIDKKKHFGKYLVIAQRVWQDIFWNTLWVTKSVWLPLKKGHPYDYIDMPPGAVRLFTVNDTDACGKLVPLFYNNQLNSIPRPKERKCGCGQCGCGGICEDVNGLQVVTKLLFTINGIDYYEKTWLKYCPNGDIWEYKEIPTKRYRDFTGDNAGDYSDDYNDDYDGRTGGLANFDITTQVQQQKLCALEVKPCGCPEDNPINQTLLEEHCGCFLPLLNHRRECYCDPFLDDPAPNIKGQVKISECGTKILYKPPLHRFQEQCIVGPGPIPRLPHYLNVSFQTNGKQVGTDILIPDFALMAHWTGIDWRSKLFNSKYPMAEKMMMKYQHNEEVNKIILFLSPFNLERLASIQDAPIRW